MRQWVCMYCGYVYDEAQGIPAQGIAPGTRLEDFPDDWTCPDCDSDKSQFVLLET